MQNKEKEEIYSLLLKQISSLISQDLPIVTNLSNITAAIFNSPLNISWVGFYLLKNKILYLGPFQGKVACTRINVGNGVCGKAVENKESLIVTNVNDFEGHIACDVESKSEIVIPLISNSNIYGVLDLDSTEFATFDETDNTWLNKICKLITQKIDLNNSILI